MQDTNSSLETEPTKRATRSKFIIFLPLIFLGALAALFIWGLKFNPNGPQHIPSALIGKKVDFTLEKMEGPKRCRQQAHAGLLLKHTCHW